MQDFCEFPESALQVLVYNLPYRLPDTGMVADKLALWNCYMRRLMEYQAGNRLKPPDIEVRDNVLTATAQADSMAIYLTLKDRIERHTSTRKEFQVVEVNRLNTWQRTWMRIGQVSAVSLILFGVYKTRKLLKI